MVGIGNAFASKLRYLRGFEKDLAVLCKVQTYKRLDTPTKRKQDSANRVFGSLIDAREPEVCRETSLSKESNQQLKPRNTLLPAGGETPLKAVDESHKFFPALGQGLKGLLG